MCPAWKDLKTLKAGNVLIDEGLKNIWEKSDFYNEFRKSINNVELIDGLCKKCLLLDKCKGGCTAQRILLYDQLDISFPNVMYFSPDPMCPLVNNYSLINSFQLKDSIIGESITNDDILTTMIALHEKKSFIYGDAWKKRGELISILPNIARKIDRLEKVCEVDQISDGESLLDTFVDLCIYCAKYLVFLLSVSGSNVEHLPNFSKNLNRIELREFSSCHESEVAKLLFCLAEFIEKRPHFVLNQDLIRSLVANYNDLEAITLGSYNDEKKYQIN